eukprot:UN11833
MTNVSSSLSSSKIPSRRTVCSNVLDFSPATSRHSFMLTTSAFPPSREDLCCAIYSFRFSKNPVEEARRVEIRRFASDSDTNEYPARGECARVAFGLLVVEASLGRERAR